eukprot:gnl/MRDRNA2_/MRDRNA2_107883_c0_seq1.p1 gnl/MRDRNA2_/MRDRNA2_107883_c0~~gnl/MRDRNA2_/MRDRNA2_107883_c0_seq1.p1  ORF type:complete len:167 (-),score=81.44 gnl/MRDRNA2_/MRDRNA2_107883_c0_seq1:12-512(-)
MADDDEEVLDEGAGIMYVRKEIYNKLKGAKEVKKEDVEELVQIDGIPDEEIMVPVDMKAVGESFEDIEQMITKLGAKGTIEAFVKARELFEKNEDGEPEEERAKEMTAQEWRTVLEEDEMDEGEEEEFPFGFEGEEEELLGLEEGEEELEDDDGEAEEPPAKKAKT